MLLRRSLRSFALVEVVFMLAGFMLAPASAAAQAGPGRATAPITAGWQDGFVLQSSDGNYRFVLGVLAQTDGRFVVDDEAQTVVNTFSIRRARPILSGRVARYFDFRFAPDFGNGNTVLQDAYFDIRFSNAFRVRTGKDKTPIGFELLHSDPYVLFLERSLASSLVPNRDVGVQAQGDLARGKLFYAGGIFNGIPDGSGSTIDQDANDSKDVAGRLVLQPFRRASSPGALSGLGFAVGGSRGRQTGALPSFRTPVGQIYFSYDRAAAADGTRTRITPSFFYYFKALGVFGEFMRSAQPVRKGIVRTDVENRAWDVTGSIVLTGEPGADRGVRPRVNFDPASGAWGALQLIARYAKLTVDRQVFVEGLAAEGASREAQSFGIGANWYPAPFIKYYATFERTVFNGDANGHRAAENAFLIRAQLAF